MPIQHASDRMLERMRRPERRRTIGDKLAWLREAIPDVAIRTTCLVGFPGETEHDFRELIAFLEEAQFDRLGGLDRKSTRLNSSHGYISYAVFCLKKKKKK